MEAIGHMLPIAVAVAVSSVPIVTMIFLLLSPNRSRAALPYLIGWVAGIAIVVSFCALLARAVPTARTERQPDTAVGIAEIVVGLALVGLAVFSWLRSRGRTAAAASTPKWLRSAGKLGPWSWMGVGFILNLRPKGILLAVAAGLTVRADADSPEVAGAAIVVYTLVASSTVAVPIIATLISPTRMEPRLVAVHDWMSRNGAVLTSVILVVIGVVVIGMGIERL